MKRVDAVLNQVCSLAINYHKAQTNVEVNNISFQTLSSAKSSDALKTDFQRCIMQITIAITLPYHQFNEWSKENVKTRTTRSRTREEKSKTSSLKRLNVN
ncbi:hypothetical protein T09_8372 [Trichinella sp. T9]|nr:hypothetical protein T09_8372 [Trichinella sp. T9]